MLLGGFGGYGGGGRVGSGSYKVFYRYFFKTVFYGSNCYVVGVIVRVSWLEEE